MATRTKPPERIHSGQSLGKGNHAPDDRSQLPSGRVAQLISLRRETPSYRLDRSSLLSQFPATGLNDLSAQGQQFLRPSWVGSQSDRPTSRDTRRARNWNSRGRSKSETPAADGGQTTEAPHSLPVRRGSSDVRYLFRAIEFDHRGPGTVHGAGVLRYEYLRLPALIRVESFTVKRRAEIWSFQHPVLRR